MKAPGFLWFTRALWLVLPFTLLEAVVDATAGAPRSVSISAQALFWALWALGALLTLLPLPSTLTGLRIVAPIGVLKLRGGRFKQKPSGRSQHLCPGG